jgi:hypothetical protein
MTSTPDVPAQFSLNQNFPNPFNPSTTIQYSVPQRSRVRLQIINILGQVKSELVNSDQDAGYHTITWSADDASGIYFYRIEVIDVHNPRNRTVESKKMILLK